MTLSISIHPPHAGRDLTREKISIILPHFNPPSPCGEGQCAQEPNTVPPLFQSTLPMRGGTLEHINHL